MANPTEKTSKLKKELSLLNVYAIATGTTLGPGFFLLPGIAAKYAGPGMVLSYLLAALILIPAMLCLVELATAMPRAGGAYYFLDRSMGPLVGTIGGLGTWLSLILKTAFALIAMGAYLNLFVPGNYITSVAVFMAVIFCIINLVGAKESGALVVYLVSGILLILGAFTLTGVFNIEPNNFAGIFDAGGGAIVSTAGLVYISYAGITKVTSVAEEIKDPERNLPLGMFLALATVLVIYLVGTSVMVSVLPLKELQGSLTPVADAADIMGGTVGKVFVTIAAIFAFFSGANAGILSSSRYPLAMSRDNLLPGIFKVFNKREIPQNSILLTVAIIILLIVFVDVTKIAKLASAFQLLVFGLCCLAVIIMRESHIEAYDPGFRSPLYPWLPIFGLVSSLWLITQMGWVSIVFSSILVGLGVIWYYKYARKRVERSGAILHVFSRLGQAPHEGLEFELRDIMKEKGLRDQDPFDELIAHAQVLDIEEDIQFDQVVARASEIMSTVVTYPADKIEKEIMDGTKVGGTPTSHGVAIPHMRLHHIVEPEILLVRSKKGIQVDQDDEFWGVHRPDGPIYALFFLISPEENPRQHLRILAKIAELVDDEHFMKLWMAAENEQEIKEIVIRDESFVHVHLKHGTRNSGLISRELKDIAMPQNSLIAIIHREGKTIVPRGNTVLYDGDRLTVIGDQKSIFSFREMYC